MADGFKKKVSGFFRRDPDAIKRSGLTRLQEAIIAKQTDAALKLLQQGANPNLYSLRASPPLVLAAMAGDAKLVRALLDKGANPNLFSHNGFCALHAAISKDFEDITFILLKNGADPNLKDLAGKTPLHHLGTSEPIAELLLAFKADPNIPDAKGNTLLLLSKQSWLTDRLLQAGADPNIRGTGGHSPLSVAIADCDLARASLLLASKKLDMAAIDKSPNAVLNILQETFSRFIVLDPQRTLIRLALEAGANPMTRDEKGKTALHCAVLRGDAETASLILKHSPACLKEKMTEYSHCTPLALLVYANLYHETRFALAKMFLEAGANPDERAYDKNTLTHLAAQGGDEKLLRLLTAARADLNARNDKEETPLMLAVKGRNLDMVDLLLDHGAEPDCVDKNGWTLLDRLSRDGDRSSPIVQRLITGGGSYRKQLPPHQLEGTDPMRRTVIKNKLPLNPGGSLGR